MSLSMEDPITQTALHEQTRKIFNQAYDVAEQKYKLTETSTALVRYAPDFRSDPFYHKVLQHMQRGEWQQAVLLLRAVTEKYPKAMELEWLLQDALVRSEIDQTWAAKIKDGRTTATNVWGIVWRTLVGLLLVGAIIAGIWYALQVRQARNDSAQRIALINEAQNAVAEQNYTVAIDLFEEVLAKDPQNPVAQSGRLEAQKARDTQRTYNTAVSLANAGANPEALDAFLAIEQSSPGYEDVAAQIKTLKDRIELKRTYLDAETAYSNQLWADALQGFERVRQLDASYLPSLMVDRLVSIYFQLGRQRVAQRPAVDDDLSSTAELFRKALALRNNDAAALAELDRLETYRQGVRAVRQSNLSEAITNFELVYRIRPQYFGGLLLEQLYDAYLAFGNQLENAGDYSSALEQYRRAMNLPMQDKSEAIRSVTRMLVLLVPSATPVTLPGVETSTVVTASVTSVVAEAMTSTQTVSDTAPITATQPISDSGATR
jgi:tetratricopeptide (TPR) repeat protein